MSGYQARPARPDAGLKIVVTGPFGAGKTTFIRTISDSGVLSTERTTAEVGPVGKTQTTVAMDFGRLTVDRDLALSLFGTPGQGRFEFMWEILGAGMLGFIVLLDATRPEPANEAEGLLTTFRRISSAPFVVAMNRADALTPAAESGVRRALALEPAVPVVGCDATDRASVKSVLLTLLHVLLERAQPAPALR